MSSISGSGSGGGGSTVGLVKFLQGNDSVQVGPDASGVINSLGERELYWIRALVEHQRNIDVGNGTAGQILTSAGAGMDAVWAAAPAGGVTINGDSGSASGSTLTFNANGISSSGALAGTTWNFTGSGSTVKLSATDTINKNTVTGLDSFYSGNAFSIFPGNHNSIYGYNLLYSPDFNISTPNDAVNNNVFGSTCLNAIDNTFQTVPAYQNNNIFGTSVLLSNSTNTMIVFNCLFGNNIMNRNAVTTANRNQVFGSNSLRAATTASNNNQVFGFNSLDNLTTK